MTCCSGSTPATVSTCVAAPGASAWSRLVWNAVSLGVVIPLGRLTVPRSDLHRYLRRSVLEFDGVRAFEERLRRAGFVDVRTEPLWGWSRGIVHSFLGRRPR